MPQLRAIHITFEKTAIFLLKTGVFYQKTGVNYGLIIMHFGNCAKVRNVAEKHALKPEKLGFQGVKSRKKGRNS